MTFFILVRKNIGQRAHTKHYHIGFAKYGVLLEHVPTRIKKLLTTMPQK